MSLDIGIVAVLCDRLPVKGHIDIKHLVVKAKLFGDAFAIAADIGVPGLEADDHDILSLEQVQF
jgi:hypothetical protein